LGEIQEDCEARGAKRGSSVNRKGRYGRLACKDREKAFHERRSACPDRCRPKSPLGESAEGRKKSDFDEGCK
jgi:hypothetical protein